MNDDTYSMPDAFKKIVEIKNTYSSLYPEMVQNILWKLTIPCIFQRMV